MDNDFDITELEDFGASIAPETVKTAENDLYHITVNDNGTLIISDKESGKVFFEMLTVMIGNENATGYNTKADVVKHTSDETYAFDIITHVPIPSTDFSISTQFLPHEPKHQHVFIRVRLGKTDENIKFSIAYEDTGNDLTLRFPTGAEYPTVSSVTGALDDVFKYENEVTLTDTEGYIFTLKTAATELFAKATSGGDLDVIMRSIAPAIGKTRYFEFEILTK